MFDRDLRPRLPAAAGDYVAEVIRAHRCEVALSRPRRTKLCDHRPPTRSRPRHLITINEDLNPYAFLTTLLHEVAHAATWERHRRGWQPRRPHGPEWRREFAALLGPVVHDAILPADVREALDGALRGAAAAATCSDRRLAIVLAHYDPPRPGCVRVEDLAAGAIFRTDCGTVFRAGPIVRTRRRCFECRTGVEYRVHGLARAEPLDAAAALAVVSGSRRRAGRPGRCAGSARPRRRPAR
ncbi:MAG: SprT-like domain-containing protein [Planctomycetaceae bacterium]